MTQTKKSNISEGIADAIGTGLRKLGRNVAASDKVSKVKAAFSDQSASEIQAKTKYINRFLSNIDSALTSYIKGIGGIKPMLKQRKLIAEMSFEQFDSLLESEIKLSKKLREADTKLDTGPIATYLTKLMINNVLKGVSATQYVQPIKVISQKLEDSIFDGAMKELQKNPDATPKANLSKVHPMLKQLANLAWAAASAPASKEDEQHEPAEKPQPEQPPKQPSDAIVQKYQKEEDAPKLAELIKSALDQYRKLGGDTSKLVQQPESKD